MMAKSEIAAVLDEIATLNIGSRPASRKNSGRIEDLRAAFRDNVEGPFEFAQAVVGPLVERGDGQILVATSATSGKPTPSASLYAGTRSAATVMLQSLGLEVAAKGVQVNVVGTNFMDFPEFLRATGGTDPEVRKLIEQQVPMRRLGGVEECAYSCASFLDGTSRFLTGQWISYSGGWS